MKTKQHYIVPIAEVLYLAPMAMLLVSTTVVGDTDTSDVYDDEPHDTGDAI